MWTAIISVPSIASSENAITRENECLWQDKDSRQKMTPKIFFRLDVFRDN